jgi:hypothetical protein
MMPVVPVRLLRTAVASAAALVPLPTMVTVAVMVVMVRVVVPQRLGRITFRHFDRRRRFHFRRFHFRRLGAARLEGLDVQRPISETSVVKLQDRSLDRSLIKKCNSPAAPRTPSLVPADLGLLNFPNMRHKLRKLSLRHRRVQAANEDDSVVGHKWPRAFNT